MKQIKTKMQRFSIRVPFRLFLLTICLIGLSPRSLLAQGTAFTYQGQLSSGGSAATGTYDLQFSLYTASSGGSQIGSTLTESSTHITNGLFTVLLDFGSVFNGSAYYLQLGVRTNGAASYTALTTRQELTPTPYAMFAEGVNASGVSGTIPSGALSGTYGGALTLNNPANVIDGNGNGLTDLNASQLTGTVPLGALPGDVALLDGIQSFTGTNTFSGNAGSFIINNNFSPINTSLFTGLSLQYYVPSGEGAIMSSYNDGYGFLSFYTKQGIGYPIVRQMMIDKYGGVGIDQQNYNNGVLDDGTTNGVGLTFGTSSGEGIASQRTPGFAQYDLDFYTDFQKRMSIMNNGFVGIGRQTQLSSQELFGLYAPVTNDWVGMYIESGVGGRPFYGYANGDYAWTELDGTDGNKWKLYQSGDYRLTVTTSGQVGIDTTTPNAQLDIEDPATSYNGLYLLNGVADGNGIFVQATNGSSAYGTLSVAPAGIGVFAETSTGTGLYAYGGSGTGVYTYSSGSALTIGAGAIHVSGANTNSSTAAFIQVATAANTSSYITTINNSLCNGDPNAILIVTHTYSPRSLPGNYETHPYSVWYNGSNWTIYNDDITSILGMTFNVLVIKN